MQRRSTETPWLTSISFPIEGTRFCAAGILKRIYSSLRKAYPVSHRLRAKTRQKLQCFMNVQKPVNYQITEENIPCVPAPSKTPITSFKERHPNEA